MIADQSEQCKRQELSRYYYRPQRSWAKVIFSEACVKNSVHGWGRGGGGGGGVWSRGGSKFSGGGLVLGGRVSKFSGVGVWCLVPGGLQIFGGFQIFADTVNERPVRILLECILVHYWNDIDMLHYGLPH